MKVVNGTPSIVTDFCVSGRAAPGSFVHVFTAAGSRLTPIRNSPSVMLFEPGITSATSGCPGGPPGPR
ncbi:MAG TPA: hypothetical protein VFM97_10645 [Gammaproteobacteria bacterium]|nr:hypothetical protein [Gammaproteobacteria bacterium]